jgi:hypothetical protein
MRSLIICRSTHHKTLGRLGGSVRGGWDWRGGVGRDKKTACRTSSTLVYIILVFLSNFLMY